jgi:antitoxin (DNA-binding transcriptional repressor) of toxin-antitoxin stability system
MSYQIGVSHSHMYTMRELNQRTAEVIKEINESGEPAAITRHGRFVALITPLVGVPVESAVLAAVLDQINQTETDTAVSGAEVARDLGLNVKPTPVRELHQSGARRQGYLVTKTVTNKDGEQVRIDVRGLSSDVQGYIARAASNLSTYEIADLVRKLKQ